MLLVALGLLYSERLNAMVEVTQNSNGLGRQSPPPIKRPEGLAEQFDAAVTANEGGTVVKPIVNPVFDKSKYLKAIADAAEKITPMLRPKVMEEQAALQDSFFENISTIAERDHGSIPKATKDVGDNTTLDIGYGHKITNTEKSLKEIHGVPYIDKAGKYIPITQEQKNTIFQKDMEMHLIEARKAGWDKKLKAIGTRWEDLDIKYKLPLMSLAYNLGGVNAGKQYTKVLQAAKETNLIDFARELRRTSSYKENGVVKNGYNKGMDNRAVRELMYSGLITDTSAVVKNPNAVTPNDRGRTVKSVLNLTNI